MHYIYIYTSSFDIKLPIFSAILQNCTWPLQACFLILAHVNSVEERVITKSMMKGYLILGALSSVITLSRTYGITQLPATLYVIFANTELIFEALLTRYYLKRFFISLIQKASFLFNFFVCVLGRHVNHTQVAAVTLVLLGLMISVYDPKTKKYGENENVGSGALTLGIFMSLLSRLCSSFNLILAERFFNK